MPKSIARKIYSVEVKNYINRFVVTYKKSVKNVIELATVIGESYANLDEESFKSFCKEIGYTTRSSYVSKMKTIYTNLDRFQELKDALPGNYTTIYDLARMPHEDFDKLVADGGVKPTMKAPKIVKEVTPKKPASNCVVKITWSMMNITGLMALQRLLSGFDTQYGCKVEFPETVQVMEIDPTLQDKLEKALAANDSAVEVAA